MGMAKTIGWGIERLKEELGLSYEDIGKVIGASRQTVSKYVKGEQIIDSAKLFKLAREFGKPMTFFFSRQPDELCFMFRANDPEKNFDSFFRSYLTQKFSSYHELLKLAREDKVVFLPNEYKLSIQGSRLTDQNKKLIQEIAERERAALGMDSDSDPDVYTALERRSINIIALPATHTDLDAVSAYSKEIGTFIFVNDHEDIPEERKRFSIIHEYAHLVIHRQDYTNSGQDFAYKSSRVDIKEKAASHFASAFLIPRDILHEEVRRFGRFIGLREIYTLKKKFAVSASAVLLALKDEGIIPAKVYGFLIRKLKEEGYEAKEPQPIPYLEKNQRLIYLLRTLFLDGKISANKIGEMLEKSPAETRTLLKEWAHNGYTED